MTQHLTGVQFRTMILNAASAIDNHKVEINELNVFPVPDGDTGTNMSLTLANGAKMLANERPESLTKAADIAASALLRGARGNSGVILSLLFRGLARHLKERETADSVLFAQALQSGVEAAYKAVMKPTEGTILTVSRLAADAAIESAKTESDIELVLEAAIAEGNVALADTINQNPVLKKAGVIDSGGKGYIYILEGMLMALRGQKIIPIAPVETSAAADFSDFDIDDITFAYCTEFIVDRKTNRDPDALRAYLDARGDSIVVVDDDEIIKVHVHTNEPGLVLTEALTFGPLLTIKIENMHEQHTEKVIEGTAAAKATTAAASITAEFEADGPVAPEKKYGSVAVCSGEGLEAIFHDLGADTIITGGQTMNPSTDDILAAIERTPAEIVFVYPNNKNIIMAAEQAVPLATRRVVVVPTKSIPQGVSAMLVFEPDFEESEIAAAQADAISNVRTILVTHAARDSLFDGHDIRAGEYLALIDDSLLSSSPDFATVAGKITEALSDTPPEFITIFSGEDSTDAESALLSERLETLGSAEITSIVGNQPVYRYMISAE